MGQKYAKLLGNLNNAVQAATGTGSRAVAAKLREEALACYRAAGIDCATAEDTRARRADIRGGEVPGHRPPRRDRRCRACCAEQETSRPTS